MRKLQGRGGIMLEDPHWQLIQICSGEDGQVVAQRADYQYLTRDEFEEWCRAVVDRYYSDEAVHAFNYKISAKEATEGGPL